MPRIPIRFAWFSILFLQVCFFSYQLFQERYLLKDSQEYIHAAENLAQEGVLYCGKWQPEKRLDFFTKRPPVYPLLIASTRWVPGFPILLLLLQNLLSLLNLMLAWKISIHLWRQSSPNPSPLPSSIPLPIFLFGLFYPAQFIYSNLVMTEIVFQSLLTGAIYFLLTGISVKDKNKIGLYSLLLCISIFTKPVMYLAALPHLLGIAFLSWKWKRTSLIAWALLPLFLVLAYQFHNENRTGYFHFSSIQNLSLFQYTAYNLLAQEYGADRATAMNDSILEVMFTLPSYNGQQKLIQGYSLGVLTSHPGPYLGMHLKGMLNFFIDPGRFDFYHFWGIEEVGGKGLQRTFSEKGYEGVWAYIQTQPLGVLGLLGLVLGGNLLRWGLAFWVLFDKRLPIVSRLILAIFIFYLAGLTGTSGASRFAVPLFPLSLSMIGFIGLSKNK